MTQTQDALKKAILVLRQKKNAGLKSNNGETNFSDQPKVKVPIIELSMVLDAIEASLSAPQAAGVEPEIIEQVKNARDMHGARAYYNTEWIDALLAAATVPRLSEQDAPTVEAIREQFENWLTGEGDLPHLKYKNFGGSYITDEACMKWDAYKAGFKAALQNAAE